ncbi:MAG: hypothetical protein LBG43_02410 [Treponema sp.]|nr:hypothetical protein [Treponema sp.]
MSEVFLIGDTSSTNIFLTARVSLNARYAVQLGIRFGKRLFNDAVYVFLETPFIQTGDDVDVASAVYIEDDDSRISQSGRYDLFCRIPKPRDTIRLALRFGAVRCVLANCGRFRLQTCRKVFTGKRQRLLHGIRFILEFRNTGRVIDAILLMSLNPHGDFGRVSSAALI